MGVQEHPISVNDAVAAVTRKKARLWPAPPPRGTPISPLSHYASQSDRWVFVFLSSPAANKTLRTSVPYTTLTTPQKIKHNHSHNCVGYLLLVHK
jgi:hypothetical protein